MKTLDKEDSTSGGISRSIIFPKKLYYSVVEYSKFVKNKTGFKPKFSDCVRLLVKEALINRKAYESEDDDEDSEEQ